MENLKQLIILYDSSLLDEVVELMYDDGDVMIEGSDWCISREIFCKVPTMESNKSYSHS